MDAISPWLHTVSAAAAGALVMGVVEGVALTGCVAVVLRMCPALSAGVRSTVWTTALVMSVLLPVGSLVMARGGAVATRGGTEVGEGWALGLVGIWAAVSAMRFAMLAVSAARLRQVWRQATPMTASADLWELLRVGRRSAELCVSADVDRPSVVGFLRPRVLLPAALLAQLGPDEMEHVVRHEMEHLQRGDDWTNLFQKLSLAAFPLNPVLFWLDRTLCRERELACDDGVLRQTRARKAYAACLANLATHRALNRIGRRGSSLALGAFGRGSELARRVHRILSWREETGMGRHSALATAALLMLSVAGGAMELARCPELVRFSSGAATVADSVARAGVSERAGTGDVMQPVMAWETRSVTGKALLVKAKMPQAPTSGVLVQAAGKKHRSSRSVAGARRVQQVPVRRRAAIEVTPRVVLTAWPEAQFPARLILTVADDGQPRYAAFATRDGWLFVSL